LELWTEKEYNQGFYTSDKTGSIFDIMLTELINNEVTQVRSRNITAQDIRSRVLFHAFILSLTVRSKVTNSMVARRGSSYYNVLRNG
jgi:hypothetical protein